MPVSIEAAAKRYALAAFELAGRESVAHWQTALDRIAAFISQPGVGSALTNGHVPPESKQELVEAGLRDLPPLPLNLAKLLVKKGRSSLAADIAAEFRRLVEEQAGISHARATTAVPLSDGDRDALVERLRQQTGRRILLETEVDPALIGGVVVQIDDRLVDASTRAKLEALRQSLVNAV